MYGTKVFLGTKDNPADLKFNEWSTNNTKIKIIKFKYQQVGYGDHSIAILYEVLENI